MFEIFKYLSHKQISWSFHRALLLNRFCKKRNTTYNPKTTVTIIVAAVSALFIEKTATHNIRSHGVFQSQTPFIRVPWTRSFTVSLFAINKLFGNFSLMIILVPKKTKRNKKRTLGITLHIAMKTNLQKKKRKQKYNNNHEMWSSNFSSGKATWCR